MTIPCTSPRSLRICPLSSSRPFVLFLDSRQWDYTKLVHVGSGTRQVLPDLYNAMRADAVGKMTPFP